MPEVPVPLGRGREPPLADRQYVGAGAGEGLHSALRGAGLELEGMSAPAMAVIVAVRDEGLQHDPQGRRCTQQFQPQIARIGPDRHENLLFQQRIGDRIAPSRNPVAYGEGLQVYEALPADCPTRELIGREISLDAEVFHGEIDLRHQKRALHRRPQARDEKPMIAACMTAGGGAARETAQAVRHQPLISAGAFPTSADITSEDHGNSRAAAAPRGDCAR